MATSTHAHSTTAVGPRQRVDGENLPASWWMPAPLDYLDRLRHEVGLSLIEQDVFLYILRRTWGYRKRADYIALSQFTHGIRDADGMLIDYGCCTKRRETVLAAAERLAACGLIAITRGKGIRPSHYTVLLDPPAGIQLTDGPAPPTDAPIILSSSAASVSRASGPDVASAVVRLADKQKNTLELQKHSDDDGRASARLANHDTTYSSGQPDDLLEPRVAALVTAGLHKTVARRLATRHTSDYIAQAIAYVTAGAHERRIDRPAGYLYRILDGGMPIPLEPRPPEAPGPIAAAKPPRDRQRQSASRTPTSSHEQSSSGAEAPSPIAEVDEDWHAVLGELQSLLTAENFTRWFSRTRVVGRHGETLVVGVPEAFHRDWLQHRLYGRVLGTLKSLQEGGSLRHPTQQVEYVVTAAEGAP